MAGGSGADHPVFTRFSRQQLIVRRRSIGFQTLTYVATTAPTRCKHCGRQLNALWKELLCHICGLWTCHHCSSVIEREREVHVIHFVRACVACLSIVNKWSDPELLTELSVSPWIVQCAKCQLALHLADTLRTKPALRRAVLQLLRHLGRPIDVSNATLLAITDDDWAATSADTDVSSVSTGTGTDATSDDVLAALGRSDRSGTDAKQSLERECAQLLVQQCFEVAVPELALDACVFAEADGAREYPIYFDDRTESPAAPSIAHESACSVCASDSSLLGPDVNSPELQLICDLVAKELDAVKAFVSVLRGDAQHSVAVPPGFDRSTLARAQTFCAFAATSPLPFLVRDAALDIRFRNLDAVRSGPRLHFYVGFPIRAPGTDHVLATLCTVDTKPRKHITTMQYSIVRTFASVIGAIWADDERFLRSVLAQHHEVPAPAALPQDTSALPPAPAAGALGTSTASDDSSGEDD